MFWSRKKKEVQTVQLAKNVDQNTTSPESLTDHGETSIISFYTGWRPFLRIVFGGVLVMGFLSYYGVKAISEKIDQQKLSPVLQQLSDMAKVMFKDGTQISVLANSAIVEAGRLPITGFTGVLSSDTQSQQIHPIAKKVLASELPNTAKENFSKLSCSKEYLHCRNKHYGIDTFFQPNITKEDLVHTQVSNELRAGQKSDLDKCILVPVISAAMNKEVPKKAKAVEENVANWITQGEACRASLENKLRKLTNKLEAKLSKVERFQKGIIHIKYENKDDETYQLLRLAPAYNIELSNYAKAVSEHDTYCYISKALGAAYLVASGDPLMARNQNEAAVVISTALGLLSCNYNASSQKFKYEWPLLNESKSNDDTDGVYFNTPLQFNDSVIEEATEKWTEEGFEVMDMICEETEVHKCVEGEYADKHCYGIQMLRKKFNDGSVTIQFANAATQKILAKVPPGSAKYVDQDGILNNNSLGSMYCNQPPAFNDQGGLEIISLKYNTNPPIGRTYMRQSSPSVAEWSVSNNPSFPSVQNQ